MNFTYLGGKALERTLQLLEKFNFLSAWPFQRNCSREISISQSVVKSYATDYTK